jgi:hypothetical protein
LAEDWIIQLKTGSLPVPDGFSRLLHLRLTGIKEGELFRVQECTKMSAKANRIAFFMMIEEGVKK